MAVRKALGPYRTLLKTESRRGYRLLGDWTVRRHDAAKPPIGLQRMRVDGESPVTNFPATVTRLVGRTAAVARLRDLMSAYRVVTLTGPGGIGKTSLALKVARGVVGEYADGGWLVELASLSDPALVPAVVARALRLPIRAQQRHARNRRACHRGQKAAPGPRQLRAPHRAVATLAETLLAHCPHTTIVTTSRETLGSQGEHVYRVPPLEVPAPGRDEADHILTSQRGRAVYRPNKGVGHGLLAACRRAPEHWRDLPASRWHPAGNRIRGGARLHVWTTTGGRRLTRSFRAVDTWTPHGTAAASDPARRARLEL